MSKLKCTYFKIFLLKCVPLLIKKVTLFTSFRPLNHFLSPNSTLHPITPHSCYKLLLGQSHVLYQCFFQTASTFSRWPLLCVSFGPADWLLDMSVLSKHASISRCWKSHWLLSSAADTIMAVHYCLFISLSFNFFSRHWVTITSDVLIEHSVRVLHSYVIPGDWVKIFFKNILNFICLTVSYFARLRNPSLS